MFNVNHVESVRNTGLRFLLGYGIFRNKPRSDVADRPHKLKLHRVADKLACFPSRYDRYGLVEAPPDPPARVDARQVTSRFKSPRFGFSDTVCRHEASLPPIMTSGHNFGVLWVFVSGEFASVRKELAELVIFAPL